jgi:GDPmannose 4,6-dehydratase
MPLPSPADAAPKRALITGITGQDGSYLAELLLGKGYQVFGVVRRASTESFERIAHLRGQITLVQADLLDQYSLIEAIKQSQPREVYNLAAQSFVPTSWGQPVLTGEFTAMGVTRVLEAVRAVDPSIRFYQASPRPRCSARCWRCHRSRPRRFTRARPTASPRCTAITSRSTTASLTIFTPAPEYSSITNRPRRGLEFVTRKVTDGVARIKLGYRSELRMGNLDARRDWGFAGDYVEAMWLMLQQDTPDDYVIATNETHEVRELVDVAFARVGLDYKKYVVEDPAFFRPAEVDLLIGDPAKATEKLGWKPKTSFVELVHMMVDADMARLAPVAAAAK